MSTQALHSSPCRDSDILKQLLKDVSYLLLLVNLELLDFALQMQQPLWDRKIFGLWKAAIGAKVLPAYSYLLKNWRTRWNTDT